MEAERLAALVETLRKLVEPPVFRVHFPAPKPDAGELSILDDALNGRR